MSVLRSASPEPTPVDGPVFGPVDGPFAGLPVLSGPLLAQAQQWLPMLVAEATRASCHRSRCAAVVVSGDGTLLGVGHNSPPGGVPLAVCRKDTLPVGFKSDRTCCVHAEQRAITAAVARHGSVAGACLYFVRVTNDGGVSPAGHPYCTICSKAALDAGIATFVLWHENGPVAYPTDVYNDLSFAFPGR